MHQPTPVLTHITLSELAARISDAINDRFYQSTCWVLADVIDHKCDAQKGHHYFCLAEKDASTHTVIAKISAAAWKNGGAAAIASFEQVIGQPFGSNIRVLANVSVQYQPAYGLKLILNDVDPTYTIGILEQHRRETLHRLVTLCPDYIRLEGDVYYTRNKGLLHAAVIQRVAVITSSAAAGFKDFKDTIEQNRFGYHVVLDTWFTAVQGEANAEGMCRRLIDIYQSGIAYDAVVIIRGGGSQADLLLFEQFVLARAVAKFPIPVITGIGHHFNQSIVDMMAHTPVKTPSIAAEFIIAHNRRFEEHILAMQQSIIIRTQQHFSLQQEELALLRSGMINSGLSAIAAAREELTGYYQAIVNSGRRMLYHHRAFLQDACAQLVARPAMLTASGQRDLDNAAHNFKKGVTRYLASQKRDMDYQASVTNILNPAHIMKRGFAVIYHREALVTTADGIDMQDNISIRFHDVKLTAAVTSKTPIDGTIADL